ncbi:PREDICTED: leucine-rich repeat-containing protein 48-like [Dinoponera quadriceps]|uniref:Dynein axonemal assembly factor 1 homolog n=1 Tax=Dinoponera quadriceps TaxID=609295 RepID=A0A6P3Y015_DINQU|nr:PREDICTED: leucine-rich repeat-containing protein 48-like [Dinoponera quadriceps]
MYKNEMSFEAALEPGVITQSILISLAIDQGPKGEAGRLFLQDGIELDKLKEIRIEFLNILNIDFLWVLKGLVKLTLSHNIIERIKNLDELVHLRELDLSFNHIKVMENLNNLAQLEILLLFSNEITVVQGIDNLSKLTILNIGKNKIANWEHVAYLRDFKALRSLNMCENPCAEIDGYTDYVFAFIPQLLYYQYRMIPEDARQSAIEKHYRVICNLEEIKAKKQAEITLQQEFEEKLRLLTASYVEYLDKDYLFQEMFVSDKDGKVLNRITKETQEIFEKYRESFSAICNELCELGLQEHKKRTEVILPFEVAVNESEENMQDESRKIVDEMLERKIVIFADIKDAVEALIEAEGDAAGEIAEKTKRLFNEFNYLLQNTRNRLMSKELVLHKQLEELNKVFKTNMTDIVNSFLEAARLIFSRLRDAEAEYNDSLNMAVLRHISGFCEDASVPVHLINQCGDKDTLAFTLATSHDIHLQIIDKRERRMINRLDDWLKEYIGQLITNETKRCRQHILEISHFFRSQEEEFNTLSVPQQLNITDIELDDVAML